MSANISTMIYVNETPWHGLGVHYDAPPKSSQEIIEGAKLDWEVDSAEMYTDYHTKVGSYHAIYRKDTNDVLGVVNTARPKLVQNTDTFNAFDSLIDKSIDLETAASLGNGENVFGCFKVREQYKIIDDAVDHYFVVLNEHLKVDGKVTVLNTPVRVVCQNTLSAALTRNFYKLRVPVTSDTGANMEIASRIISSVGEAIQCLQKRAEKMVSAKIDRSYVETVLDELFPYVSALDSDTYSRANETTSMIRETFLTQCMGADNLANYRGTAYQVFNALTDFETHYFKQVDKAYDLNHRMKLLPGIGTESGVTAKYLNLQKKLIA